MYVYIYIYINLRWGFGGHGAHFFDYHPTRKQRFRMGGVEKTALETTLQNHSNSSLPTPESLKSSNKYHSGGQIQPSQTPKPQNHLSRVPPHPKPPCNKYYLLTATPLEATPLETTLQQVLLAHSHPTRSHLTRIAAVLRVPPFFQLSSKPINSESNILRAWICSGSR